ncbi:MAG TPA: hypothetical protein VFV50_07515 [Bdellovibrionales bacterium]|nr:hypothetical protein [Bdellovibrionales bacterium]
MKVDLPASDTLKSLRAEIAARLAPKVPEKHDFRIHPSLSFAINEVTRGLARLFPHRRSISMIQGCGPYFDPLMSYFSAEGYSLQTLPFSSLQSTDWIETLKKDTLFVLLSADDPLTGQLFETEAIQNLLEQKKIFSIVVSHAVHAYRPQWPSAPYKVHVLSGGSRFALSVLGERALKIEALLFGPADWAAGLGQELDSFFEVKTEDRELVLRFEASGWGGSTPFFAREAKRVYDRAAIFWGDMDGEAMIHELAAALQIPLLVPGQESQLETASLCRWKGLKTLNWLTEQGVASEVSRGLVLISKNLLSDKLGEQIDKTRAHILKLQNG